MVTCKLYFPSVNNAGNADLKLNKSNLLLGGNAHEEKDIWRCYTNFLFHSIPYGLLIPKQVGNHPNRLYLSINSILSTVYVELRASTCQFM